MAHPFAAAVAVATERSSGSMWVIMAAVVVAGAVGGLMNALMTDKGFAWPRRDSDLGVLRIGWIAQVVLGAFAAVLSWGLYGPLKDAVLLGPHPEGELPATLTVTVLFGAALVGAGGSRVVANEVEKRIMAGAAADAATAPGSPELADQMRRLPPAEAAVEARKAAKAVRQVPARPAQADRTP